MHRLLRTVLLIGAALMLIAPEASTQDVERVSAVLLSEVMPDADRFDAAEGEPPVKRAHRGEELVGYVFLTSDLPPEEQGYSGPIRALVGVNTAGVITGVRVTQYRESYRYEMGDFLSDPRYLGQFVGKEAGDPFLVGADIDGMSRVTISVRAMSRGIRDDARRVVLAYSEPRTEPAGVLTEAELVGLPWYEMQRRGAAATMTVQQERRSPFEVSIIRLSSPELGEALVGRRYAPLVDEIEEAGGADEIYLYVVGGAGFVPRLTTGWSVEQDGTTLSIPRERVVYLGTPAGLLATEASQVGALLLDERDGIDATAAVTFGMDRGRPDLGTFRVTLAPRATAPLVAEAPRAPTPEMPPTAPEPSSTVETAAVGGPSEDEAAPSAETQVAAATADPATAVEPATEPPAAELPADVELVQVSEEEMFGTSLPSTWSSLKWTVLVIVLACLAFFTKNGVLRWTSLVATTVLLGWVDGGFLSISHVTGLVWVGLAAIRSDPALLVLTLFTVISVLLWGRVFCGFLCPFGTLQDLIDRLVPRRFKRQLPANVHRMAWKAKYVILAAILGAAIIGWEVSLYQYFEPFGTVFFVGRSAVLWAIAAAALVASAIVPRFYCRYVCPLGALLAVGSVLSLRRIPRVEQCDHCHVCEQRCPTGAIQGPTLSFTECVRCNVCEVQLIEQRGVCRHDMEDVRHRLVQLRLSGAGTTDPAGTVATGARAALRRSALPGRISRPTL